MRACETCAMVLPAAIGVGLLHSSARLLGGTSPLLSSAYTLAVVGSTALLCVREHEQRQKAQAGGEGGADRVALSQQSPALPRKEETALVAAHRLSQMLMSSSLDRRAEVGLSDVLGVPAALPGPAPLSSLTLPLSPALFFPDSWCAWPGVCQRSPTAAAQCRCWPWRRPRSPTRRRWQSSHFSTKQVCRLPCSRAFAQLQGSSRPPQLPCRHCPCSHARQRAPGSAAPRPPGGAPDAAGGHGLPAPLGVLAGAAGAAAHRRPPAPLVSTCFAEWGVGRVMHGSASPTALQTNSSLQPSRAGAAAAARPQQPAHGGGAAAPQPDPAAAVGPGLCQRLG